MFSTCLVCHRGLGTNETLETFPVGRKLAFDARVGRLWVVCTKCGHWNLSPLEERWEAVEQGEKLFRSSPIKSATDNIGLTKLGDGTELVRIGKPLRPEFAAWRYGPRLVARRPKAALHAVSNAAVATLSTVGAIGAAAVYAAGAAMLRETREADDDPLEKGWQLMEKFWDYRRNEKFVTTVTSEAGVRYALRRKHMRLISLETDHDSESWKLMLRHDHGVIGISGAHATVVAGQLLAIMNVNGASRATVQSAAHRISDAGDAQAFIRKMIAVRDKRRLMKQTLRNEKLDSFGLKYEERLAVEMAMHEETEVEAMRGDLTALERAWREAEEIGAIADKMFEK